MMSERVESAVKIMLEGYGRRVSEAALTAYATALNGIPEQWACKACHNAIIECEYCPSPAQLRGAAKGLWVDRPKDRDTYENHVPPTKAEREQARKFAADFVGALYEDNLKAAADRVMRAHYGTGIIEN
jgi:hypothetical protein